MVIAMLIQSKSTDYAERFVGGYPYINY
jgi:hypothetical protein